MTDLSIHDVIGVRTIKLDEVEEDESCPAYCIRTIEIETAKNGVITIHLFGDTLDSLIS